MLALPHQSLPMVSERSSRSQLLAYNLFPQLLKEQIIDKAIQPITCSAAETEAALESFFKLRGLHQEAEQTLWMNQHEITQAQIEFAATRPLRIEKFKAHMWQYQLPSYFLERKDQLDRVIYSCIRVKSKELAGELYHRIYGNEQTFFELARNYSEGPEAFTGGIIGPVELGRLPVPLAQILRVSQAGQLRCPVAFETCSLILRVEKIIPAQLDAAMCTRLMDELFETWLQQQMCS